MTRYKSNLVNKYALANFSRILQFQPYLIILKHKLKKKNKNKKI